MGMHDYRSNLIEGYTTNSLVVFLNEQKTTVAGKVTTILTYIYDLIQIAPDPSNKADVSGDLGYIQAFFGGPGSLMRPISSMITRRAPDFIKDAGCMRI